MNTPRTDSPPDAPPGWIIQPSPRMAVIVALLAVFAAVAAWLNGLPLVIRLVLVLAVLVYAFLQSKALLFPRYRRIGIEPASLILTDSDGNSVDLAVQGRPFVSPLFIGLRARRRDNRRLAVLGLFRGQLDELDYRSLAARLRMEPKC